MSEIPKIITESYPTRYKAFAIPNTIIEQRFTDLKNGGREIMVYYEPYKNTYHTELTDGIYAQIVSYQGVKYMAEINATRPDRQRKQKNAHFMSNPLYAYDIESENRAYQSAYNWIIENLPEFQEFIGHPRFDFFNELIDYGIDPDTLWTRKEIIEYIQSQGVPQEHINSYLKEKQL